MATASVTADRRYSPLKDVRVEIDGPERSFVLCFWLYLPSSTPFPSTLLTQMHSGMATSLPFLMLDEKKKMMLLPPIFLQKDTPLPWTKSPHASAKTVFPIGEWIHVGCEVGNERVRLHINGKVVGEELLSSSLAGYRNTNCYRSVSLVGTDGGDDRFQGYVYGLEVLDKPYLINHHFVKDPPLQLSIDGSGGTETQEDRDGAWCIVGDKQSSNFECAKTLAEDFSLLMGVGTYALRSINAHIDKINASCCNDFFLNIILVDAFGLPVNKEIEVVATLLYADNGALVDNLNDGESPLVITSYGAEFRCPDRPCKLTNGRATFKLKISQLSAECNDRQFNIRFHIPRLGSYPFFEAFSGPIRCISNDCNTRTSSPNSVSAIPSLGGAQASGLDNDFLHNNIHEANLTSYLKLVNLGNENSFPTCKDDHTIKRANEESESHLGTFVKGNTAYGRGKYLERRSQNHEVDNFLSNAESNEARYSDFKSMSCSSTSLVSDFAIFKYGLGGLKERALFLKELARAASDKELATFAEQASILLGCSHHGKQILIAKRLVEDGTKVWDLISQNDSHVSWENVVSVINQWFVKIARCSSRSLTQQDLELLRRIAGCEKIVAQENFEKLWCRLYPVTHALSRVWVNSLWNSAPPMCIEGFITKEEAESSLVGPNGLQEPGTFVLRFPTSRSWPHPDAGDLVVTYVGSDYTIHHKMLSLDFIFSSGGKPNTSTPLQDLLLSEPELSRFGRIVRTH